MVEITPEIKAQLEEQKKQCIFCKISSGEIPSEIIFNEEKIVSVLDINPCSKAHVLMYTKEHYPIMPYIPSDEFFNLFGSIPQMSKMVKKAVLADSVTVFIANGAVAGQQSPHFLLHVISRDSKDKVSSFSIQKADNLDSNVISQLNNILSNNIPIMLQNHARRNPDLVPKKKGLPLGENMIYSDEWVSVFVPEEKNVMGHLIVKPNDFKTIESMPVEIASHLFFVCSFVATALFESLGAQGTNIILHSGKNSDNPDGDCIVHVIARFQEDGLNLIPVPSGDKPDFGTLGDKVRSDKLFISHNLKEARKRIKNNVPVSTTTVSEHAKNQIESAINALRKL